MVRKALFLSMIQRYVAFGISFVSSMVLARLLSPGEVGIYTLAAAVVAVATMLRDFGVGDYIIQEQNLTRDKQRAAFTVTLGMAWFIALVLAVLARPLSIQYHEAGLAAVLYVLACNFLLLPFGSVTFAILTKNMAFGTIFVVQTTSVLLHAAVSISLAYRGLSYMSLAWASLIGTVTTIVMLALLRPAETLLWPKFSGLHGVARFGGLLTFAHLINQAVKRAPDFLIGGQLGFHSLGLFSRGAGLIDSFNDLFTAAISRVAGPMFASKERDTGVLRHAFIYAASMYSVVAVPFFLFLAILSKPLIHALFGPTWLSAVTVAQILAVGAAISSPYMLSGPFLTGTGQPGLVVRVTLVRAPLAIGGLVAGMSFGLESAATGLLIGGVANLYFYHNILWRAAKLRWLEVARVYRSSFSLGLVSAAVASPALFLYDGSTLGALLSLAAGATLAATCWGFMLPHLHPALAAEIRSALKRLRGLLPGQTAG